MSGRVHPTLHLSTALEIGPHCSKAVLEADTFDFGFAQRSFQLTLSRKRKVLLDSCSLLSLSRIEKRRSHALELQTLPIQLKGVLLLLLQQVGLSPQNVGQLLLRLFRAFFRRLEQ